MLRDSLPQKNEDGTFTIPLTKGYSCIVDEIDVDLGESLWCAFVAVDRKYAARGAFIEGKWRAVFMHRVIMARIIDRPLDKGEMVDHIDNNASNNCRSNLRIATRQDNTRNRKINKRNTSGFKGVKLDKKADEKGRARKWLAAIRAGGKSIHLGSFTTPEEAHAAYCEAAKKYHGEFARFE